jgi:hypothetical protein
MCARFQSDPRECHLVAVKWILRYLVAMPCFGIWYPKGSTFDLIGYSDSDYAGCKVDRKSTSGTCQFLGRSLVSWSSKKQTSVALSTAKAEYVAAGQCCAQLLWMRHTLRDFDYNLSKVPLLCDNESAICMADNPVEHSRTKHIDIRHNFLRDHQQKRDIEVFYVSTENQLADIFTKPLDESTFCKLRSELNVLDSRNLDWVIAYMCFMPWSCSLLHFVVYLWCSSCTSTPRTSQVHLQVMHIFRGRCATTWPFETNCVLSLLKLVSKEVWKGKSGLGPCKTSTALRWKSNWFQVHLCTLIAFLLLVEDFGEAMGLKGQNWSRFGAWCQRGRK